ncbi:MAG: metal-sensitive transcriptional regulator [Spirochaetales bacterium]|nr:metal-sensitive transcriptional regulator [Spirochaetales bacterium]
MNDKLRTSIYTPGGYNGKMSHLPENTCCQEKKGPEGVNQDALKRLKRAQGQVGGVIRMVEMEAYCPDILVQISAARAALQKASLSILRRHVESCVTDALRTDDGLASIDELMRVIERHGG